MPRDKLSEQPYFSHAVDQPPDEPWPERVAAYQRHKPQLEQFAHGQFWTREKFIVHWQAMLNNPKSTGLQLQFATEALAYLGADSTSDTSQHRQPGED